MKIKDECPCGSRFEVATTTSYAHEVHTDWLDAHFNCREKAAKELDKKDTP